MGTGPCLSKRLLFPLGAPGRLMQMTASASIQCHLGGTEVTGLCSHAQCYMLAFRLRSPNLSGHTADLLNHCSGWVDGLGLGFTLNLPLCVCLHECKHTLCMQVPAEPECIGCPGMETEDGSAKRVLGTEPRTSGQAVGALLHCPSRPWGYCCFVLFCF